VNRLSLLLISAVGFPLSVFAGIRPDPELTPGLIRPQFGAVSPPSISGTVGQRRLVCDTQWGKDARHVTVAMKKQIAAAYHVAWSRRAEYEFDHLVPRELGGADDIKNIWPQPRAIAGPARFWNAHRKDVLENKLHRLVCSGRLSLAEAQGAIAADWISTYNRFVALADTQP
jgi:hypothetical protein